MNYYYFIIIINYYYYIVSHSFKFRNVNNITNKHKNVDQCLLPPHVLEMEALRGKV